ncbi:MAG: DUF58 domain-containing protein [Bryobacteraceae bacterium]|nr:DUF58 domain-containing protein [Bryobacteraceae bacterium]
MAVLGSGTRQSLVEKGFLEKLERLTIHWQKSFPGLVGGRNASRFSGPGLEFLDHRHFHHGDDLRAVNWRAYMRLEKLFLKMFQVEPRVPVRLLLDTSASMSGGDSGAAPAKFDYARRLAAALSYVALVRLDTIALQPFTDTLHDSFLCGGGRHRFAPAVDFLTQLQTSRRTDFGLVVREFVGKYMQRGLLIVISDFLEAGDCRKHLQYLADFGHELLLIQLWADEDRTPPWDGELDLEDAETGDHLDVSFDATARKDYTRAFDEYAEGIERLAMSNGGRYIGLPTSVPIEDAIFGPLVRTKAIVG